MGTPAIADFPDDLDRLGEWQRRRALQEERRRGVVALARVSHERTVRDWTWIAYSPYGTGGDCGC